MTLAMTLDFGFNQKIDRANGWLYLLDSHQRRCGMVEIHNVIYLEQLNGEAKVLVLSGAQPANYTRLPPIEDHPHHEKILSSSNEPVSAIQYPAYPLSTHEGTTEADWKLETGFDFHRFYAKEVPAMGTEGPFNEEDISSTDTHKFDFYNIMLVVQTSSATTSQEDGPDESIADVEDSQSRIMLYERVGLGLLHYDAIRWACAPGPEMEEIWLT
ncbi:MAG: hypothetical protein Q9220_002440 [cf. Caloplaca sp. 1 TL-2023]